MPITSGSITPQDRFGIGHSSSALYHRLPKVGSSSDTDAETHTNFNPFSVALKNQTLHIRIAGVDAPEAAHFGKPAQPGSVEALAFLKGKLEGKRIWTKLVRKDQYSRIVGFILIITPR
jgi:endonuclease YncB( thermonuclease family)